jgi:hypothetical protein
MKRNIHRAAITAVVILLAIAAEIFTIYELNSSEDQVLEIYGTQQDGYVKLILEEINRLGDEGTQEDITEIISDLDATASRYWTLSRDGSILFVKSVTETNRYKAFTDGSYFATETAMTFVENMEENQVNHGIIYLDEDRFVASGMIFSWQGDQYRICLLTYDKVVIEDNILLECKNAIIASSTIVLALLVIISMVLERGLSRRERAIYRKEEQITRQNLQLEQLDEQLNRANAYNAGREVFLDAVLPEFLQELDEQQVCPLHFALYKVEESWEQKAFFHHMQAILDYRVLRFLMKNGQVLLIFAGYDKRDSTRLIETLQDWKVRELGDCYCEDNMKPYTEQFETFWKEMGKYEP